MEKFELNDFRKLRGLSEVTFSPDGRHIAVVVKSCNEQDGYDFTIWTRAEGGEFRQLTSFGKESSYLWDDVNTLMFLSLRDPVDQKRAEAGEELTGVYRLRLDGGEAIKAFTLPIQAGKLEKIKDGLYLVTARCDANLPDYYKMSAEERKQVAEDKKKNAEFHVLDETPFWSNGTPGFTSKMRTRLFLYDEKKAELTPCSDPLFQVEASAVVDQKIYYSGCAYTLRTKLQKDVWCYDLNTGENRQVYVNEGFGNRSQNVATDGSRVLFCAAKGDIWGQNEHPNFYELDPASGTLTLLAEADLSYYLAKPKDGALWINGNDRVSNNLFCFGADNELKKMSDWNGDIGSFDIHGDQAVISGKQGTEFDEVWTIDLKTREVRCLSDFNHSFLQTKSVSECEPLTIASHDWDVDGWVMKPVDFDPEKTYPAILTIHGGPKGAYHGTFGIDMQTWASAGYFVFFCNPIGSDGRGNEFAEIREKHGTVDYEDIMNFTDEVLKRYPQIEPQRMGVTGISYGGYMTNWIIGHTDRFKAASSQCSVVNWVSMYGVSDISMEFVPDQMGGSIFEKTQTYWDRSPLKYACNAVTPTLFIQPLADFRCHLSDGLQMITALMDKGVETRVVCFDGDHHGLNNYGKPSHRERSYSETLNWMDSHLK